MGVATTNNKNNEDVKHGVLKCIHCKNSNGGGEYWKEYDTNGNEIHYKDLTVMKNGINMILIII